MDSARTFNGFPPVKNVEVIKDSEVLRVGTLAITANFTPGHTPGSTTWTWQSCEGSQVPEHGLRRQHFRGSAPGFKFTAQPALVERDCGAASLASPSCPATSSISTHPAATNLDDKIKKRAAQKGGPDPFVDHGCKALAATAMKGLEARIAEEKK